MSDFKFPTEIIELPSKGLVYPKENPLSSGQVELKYMTAKHEDILTNMNLVKSGLVFDKLLQSLIVSKINYDDLTIGDKNALLVAARILGYGKDYKVSFLNKNTGEEEPFVIDLSKIENKEVDYSLFQNKNEFTFTLPNTNNEVTFKLATNLIEKNIESELNSNKKINISSQITTRLRHVIVAVNGDRDPKAIRTFVEDGLMAADAKALRDYMKHISPDLNMTFTFTGSDGYTEEGVEIPMGFSFFYPNS
jgi:hypothetical protein